MRIVLFISILTLQINSALSQISFTRIELDRRLDGIESIHAADYDGDGDSDVFTASDNDHEVVLFKNEGNSQLEQIELSSGLLGASVVKSFDFDNDGDLDIIASGTEPGDHSICWWENHLGTFGPKLIIARVTGQSFQDFTIFDIDNDGDNDVVSVEFSTASGPGILALWENQEFTFEYVELSDNCIDGRQIEIIDWDTDGDYDFIVSEGLGDEVALWSNEGDLVFTKTKLVDCRICTSFSVKDINGDGFRDIVVSSFIEDEISIFLNDRNSSYTKFTLEDEFDGPDKLIVYDIDRDGDLDIIVAYYLEDLLVLYENQGGLNFLRNIIDYDFDGGRDLYITDFDNDNAPDILGASLGAKKGVIWVNNLVISNNHEEMNKIPEVKFSNPSRDWIYLNDTNRKELEYYIYNKLGKLILSGKTNNDQIDARNIKADFYIIKISDGIHSKTSKIIIK